MSQSTYIDPEQVKATRPKGAVHPRLEIDGVQTVLAAQVKLIFPLSRPAEYLSIQDGEGKEVAILRTMEGLEPESRRVLGEQIDRRYFTPSIERIDLVKQEAGMLRFVVLTNRGETEFYVRNWRDNAYEIAPGRWQINSVDGGRFDIPSLDGLDLASRRLLEMLL